MGLNKLIYIKSALHDILSKCYDALKGKKGFYGIKTPMGGVLFILLISISLMSCSSTSWVVVDEGTKDINDFELISSRFYLESTNGITPNQPLIHFDLKAINTYEYAKRVRSERYIQRYRPRLGYVLLGAAGAGLSYFAAFSDQLVTEPTNTQRYSLIGAGTLLTGLSFLNMKPIGEPSATGESRLLRKIGAVQESDTVNAKPYNSVTPSIRLSYSDSILAEHKGWDFRDGRISINLAEEIDAGIFEETPSDNILVEVFYDSLSRKKEVPVSSVFEQFVVVDAQITALRNAPVIDNNNVLTDLAEGSQLKLVKKEGDWYKVLYGISETWVSVDDVNTIWRSSEFASDLSVITIPSVPFGSVDVEQNIPDLGLEPLNSSAFILSNFQFENKELSERIYGERDVELMEAYFSQALAIRSNNIIKAINISSERSLEQTYSRLAIPLDEPPRNLIVYINGYAEIRDSKVYLIGSELNEEGTSYLDLQKFFEGLSSLRLNSLVIFADLDILNNDGSSQPFRRLASTVTDSNYKAAVLFAGRPNQRSGIYSSSIGEQKRHSIFTYYLAEAFKQGKLRISEVYDHLERNVPFTSRSIYDRPQNPLLFGDRDLELLN
ncbi:MAG: hypothetical protein HUJ22_04075 [Gracilimonas sp.]|uniref:hypothetical protein n=1 Tax=Gracilimonas sp. TaxID=1974203 RepID=UPI001993C791|nr:hypothetical protein [Gracilimonas sp.]MBD3615728.1 hypothetical protein [Gracilimonas sp.]